MNSVLDGLGGLERLVLAINENVRLQDDNARLRELLKQVEQTFDGYGNTCPWCGESTLPPTPGHTAECRAFNPDGTVK